MFIELYFIICFACVCFSTDYNIVWDQNYCDNIERYPSSYELPHNSPCALCINDVITLRINSSSSDHYENIYRVPNEEQMLNCNATVNDNNAVTFFKDMHEIEILNAGSNPAFNFQFQLEPYYFISTSDGSQSSAQNDLLRPPNSCLQFAFRVLLDADSRCGNYKADCVFSSVFTNSTSSLYCPPPTTPTTMTETTPTTITTPVTTTTTIQTTRTQIATTSSETTNIMPLSNLSDNNSTRPLLILITIYTSDPLWLIVILIMIIVVIAACIVFCSIFGFTCNISYALGKISFPFDKKRDFTHLETTGSPFKSTEESTDGPYSESANKDMEKSLQSTSFLDTTM